MEYREALDWLYSVQQFGIKPGLDNTRKLLKVLQLPGTRQRFIHVAGTNGKGSTCAFMESILRAGGERTGLFTSPHLVQFRERIQVCGEMIPEEEVLRSILILKDLVSTWHPHPTFFELTLAIALDWFDRAGAEIVVLETGMGGRLDATNVVTPLVSVITPIALDHQQWLGETIALIAGEKAGIIKPDIPVVCAPQKPEAESVLRETASERNSFIRFVNTPYTASELPLAGRHQQLNAALALAALEAAHLLPKPDAVLRGLSNTYWPARFQILNNGRLIVDGAHNPHSIAQLVETWKEKFGNEKCHLIFGALEGKNHEESLRLLAPITAEATFITVNSPRSVPGYLLLNLWNQRQTNIPAQTKQFSDENLLSRHTARNLFCGSLYGCAVFSIGNPSIFEVSQQ